MLFRFAQIFAFCAILGRHRGHLAYPALTFGLVLKGPKEDQLFKLVLTFCNCKMLFSASTLLREDEQSLGCFANFNQPMLL